MALFHPDLGQNLALAIGGRVLPPPTGRSSASIEFRLLRIVRGRRVIVMCVGSIGRGDDALAPLLARTLKPHVKRLLVLNCGTTPDRYMADAVVTEPEVILFVNAVDAGLRPGAIRLRELTNEDIPRAFPVNHVVPASVVASIIRELVKDKGIRLKSYLLSVQAKKVRGELSRPMRSSLEQITTMLRKADEVAAPF